MNLQSSILMTQMTRSTSSSQSMTPSQSPGRHHRIRPHQKKISSASEAPCDTRQGAGVQPPRGSTRRCSRTARTPRWGCTAPAIPGRGQAFNPPGGALAGAREPHAPHDGDARHRRLLAVRHQGDGGRRQQRSRAAGADDAGGWKRRAKKRRGARGSRRGQAPTPVVKNEPRSVRSKTSESDRFHQSHLTLYFYASRPDRRSCT
jgi:hypothetical protein